MQGVSQCEHGSGAYVAPMLQRRGRDTVLRPCLLQANKFMSLPPVTTEYEFLFLLTLQESFLDEGFILDKKIGVGQPKRIENAKILVANTAMDTDKIKIYGARVRVDSMQKVGYLMHCLQL